MSVFKGVLEGSEWKCIGATKNISKEDEYNRFIVALYFQKGEELLETEVKAVYSVNKGGKISHEEKIGVTVKVKDCSKCSEDGGKVLHYCSDYSRNPQQISDTLLDDLSKVITLFDEADKEVRRVYL